MKTVANTFLKFLSNALVIAFIGSIAYGQSATPAKHPATNDTIKTFEKLCNKIRDVKGDYTMAGVIDIKNPVNPTLEIKNVSFLFCKKGEQFYYKLGTTETLNAQGVYLYIDHGSKNIMVSAQKKLDYGQGPLKSFDFGETIKSEHYKLQSSASGQFQTISLINEHHISCKQYSLTFEPGTLKIKRLFMRLTDVQDPFNKAKEETVDVHLTQWDHSADISKYITPGRVIRTVKGKTYATNEFRNYRIINM